MTDPEPSADSIRNRIPAETQREIDARFASWFSTSSELAAYDADQVRELYRKAR